MWKRSHGYTTKAPPDERGGNRYVQPKATAPHLDSTRSGGSLRCRNMSGVGGRPDSCGDGENGAVDPFWTSAVLFCCDCKAQFPTHDRLLSDVGVLDSREGLMKLPRRQFLHLAAGA